MKPLRLFESFFIFLLYCFLFLPVIVLIVFSFNSASSLGLWAGFSTKWYTQLSEDVSILEALVNSIEIAFCASFLSGLLGLCVGMSKKSFFKKIPLIPIVLPDIVQGISLLCFFILLQVPLGKMTVVLAHSSFGAAYVSTMIRSRIKLMDPLLVDAASDLGAPPFKVFYKVILPQLFPALLSGMLMVFTMSFDDFIVAFFTAGVGAATLPLKIYSMLKLGVTPVVNALSTVIFLTSLVLITLAFWNQPKEQKT